MHKVPVLLLTTTGRKTGRKRTTPLLYARDGNRLVIVASNGGRRMDPSWWRNLKHNPIAMVQVKDVNQTVYAQRAIGSEKERLWQMMTGLYPAYDQYQQRTDREIPVVVLRPKIS